jgi:hypothetical protein
MSAAILRLTPRTVSGSRTIDRRNSEGNGKSPLDY